MKAEQTAPGTNASPVDYKHSGRVAVITHDRPAQRNAWGVDSVRATVAALLRANEDDGVGAIVLTAAGDTYCAGADLKAEAQYDPDTGRRLTPATFTMGRGDNNWLSLLERSKPVIVAINGPAVGIGATHPLAADIRIAAESASFSFPFLRLGAMPECGSTALLPRLVGAGRARDIILRSATVSAQEALAIGLVTAVYPDEQLSGAALALGEQVAELPALQVKLSKRMLNENALATDPDEIMRNENAAFVEMLKTLKREKPL